MVVFMVVSSLLLVSSVAIAIIFVILRKTKPPRMFPDYLHPTPSYWADRAEGRLLGVAIGILIMVLVIIYAIFIQPQIVNFIDQTSMK